MKISLIGMANSGKTYWSKKLNGRGFTSYSCDDMIEEELSPELAGQGFSGIADLARWMGMPYEPQYQRNSQLYLDCECRVMQRVLDIVEAAPVEGEHIVIDTTGSVIYTSEEILERLKKHTLVIYIQTPSTIQKRMYDDFLACPKPVIWHDSFQMAGGQSVEEALASSYGDLLAYRSGRYEQFADIRVDYDQIRSPEFGVEDFLELIRREYDRVS